MLEVLEDMPSDLPLVYDRMMKYIQQLQRRYPQHCLRALSAATVAYQPLHLREIHVVAGLQEKVRSLEDMERIINMCGSFLTIRDNYVYFIHQSAKDISLQMHLPSSFPPGMSRSTMICSHGRCIPFQKPCDEIYTTSKILGSR